IQSLLQNAMKKICIFSAVIVFLFLQKTLSAQTPKSWGVETNFYTGKILKHSSKILFDVEGLSQGFDINIKYQTYGKHKWSQYQRYPIIGVGLVYFNLGDKDVLGNAIAFLPNVSVPLLRTERGFINFQFGTGLAYLTRFYDYIENPTNNAIGSHWNNITHVKFNGGMDITPQWMTQVGFGVIHYSNGASQLPNLGINIVSASVGVKYTPDPVERKDFLWDDDFKNVPQKRWGFQTHLGLGFREFGEPGGNRYPIYNISTGAVFHFNAVNRMVFGFEGEYSPGVYHYNYHLEPNADSKELHALARKLTFFVADELMFGNLGVYILLGTYIEGGDRKDFDIYNKLSFRYYFPPIGKPTGQFFVAVHLKSHLSVAEYISLGAGVNF
ncbi:MAG: acyloxyacyl hydrolase, partial [Saprospiraceae bacterium]